jgi:uncharacterized Tic20 family protein
MPEIPAAPINEPLTIAPTERGLAALTHLSGLAGYLIPLGGILVPIVIWMVKSESTAIANIAKQAIILNVVTFVAIILGIVMIMTVILLPVGILLICGMGLFAIVLPIVGAVKASSGVYFRYPVIGVAPRLTT